jgi:phage portal protein BeeE
VAPAPLAIPPRAPYSREPLALPTVYGIVRLHQTAVGQLQLGATTGGRPDELPLWLRRPELGSGGKHQTWMIGYAVASLDLAGYAAWWAAPLGDGWDLEPLMPRRVTATFDQKWRTVWSLDGERVDEVFASSTTEWRTPGLLIAPFFIDPSKALPLGPLQAAREAAAGWTDVEAFSANTFGSGRGNSGRYLATEQPLPAETLQEYADVWMAKTGSPDAGIPALGGGLRVEDSMLDPATAQWVQSREFNAQEAARLYGVPPRYLGLPSGDASTYATARDNDAQLLRFSVGTVTGAIAAALSSLFPARTRAEDETTIGFSAATLLASTPLEENQADQIAIDSGILNPDEVRARRGLGPAPVRQEVPADAA